MVFLILGRRICGLDFMSELVAYPETLTLKSFFTLQLVEPPFTKDV